MNVALYLKEQAALVDAALDRYTSPDPVPHMDSPADGSAHVPGSGPEPVPSLSDSPPLLLEAIRYSLLGSGKRLRPALVLAGAALFDAPAERVMPTACALEMIHTYSLIHDDLPCMDDDDMRRGRPTNHKVYNEAIATLAGDALLTMAFELMGRQAQVDGITPIQAARVVVEVATAAGANGMVGGQIEDIAWEGRAADSDQLRRIHRLKTGALFRAALRCGAILGGAQAAELRVLDQYAEEFGLAFQIQDDVLDVIGDAVKTGKGVGRDKRHQKSTYVSHYGLAGAQELARAAVSAAKQALAPFGAKAQILTSLAEFVVDRDA